MIPDRCKWDWQVEESQHSELTETASVMSDMAIMAEQGATNYTDRACESMFYCFYFLYQNIHFSDQ